MKFSLALKYLFGIAWFKTLRFNLHFFGKKGWKCPVVLYHGVKIEKMTGTVEVTSFAFGSI